MEGQGSGMLSRKTYRFWGGPRVKHLSPSCPCCRYALEIGPTCRVALVDALYEHLPDRFCPHCLTVSWPLTLKGHSWGSLAVQDGGAQNEGCGRSWSTPPYLQDRPPPAPCRGPRSPTRVPSWFLSSCTSQAHGSNVLLDY